MTKKQVKLTSLKADLERERAGDWITYPGMQGVMRFNVSGWNKPEYQTAKALKAAEAVRLFAGLDRPPEDWTREADAALVVEHLLHDWDGIDAEFDPESARDLYADPEYRVLKEAIDWCITRIGTVDVAFEDAAEKN